MFPLTAVPMRRLLALGGAILCGFVSTPADGALLLGSVDTAPPAPADLTAAGTLDWAIWGTTSTTASATKAPVNDKSGGTILGSLSEVTGGNLRGGIASTQTFSYSDGTSPSSQTGVTFGLIFPVTLDSVGNGVQLSVAGDPAVQRIIRIWGSGTQGVGTLTASLNGAPDVVLVSQTYGGTKTPTLFTINYQPDAPGDVLTVRYVLSTDGGGGNSHVGFQAAAISAVPEPATAMLLLGGAGILVMRRRR
jgi:hypothetical protein